MTSYESLKELNSSLRSKPYFNYMCYVKHVKIDKVVGDTVYCVLYSQKQKNKQKVEEKTMISCSVEELVRGLQNRSFYINNLSKIKSFLV